ncbi:unnamed protein product [Dovyalis caffra]|uniref:Uncharacterized protein n=1 Tax=Dovyalis caffra TaxID=77055 RepID=A0AAV1RTF8_9ROSI|nr:unnamed protein product [Dovyalis caffra]
MIESDLEGSVKAISAAAAAAAAAQADVQREIRSIAVRAFLKRSRNVAIYHVRLGANNGVDWLASASYVLKIELMTPMNPATFVD